MLLPSMVTILSKHILNINYKPGSVLGSGDATISRKAALIALEQLISWELVIFLSVASPTV